MRIQLDSGKQKELILLAKKDETWKKLAQRLNLNMNYLCNELFTEKRTLSEEHYHNLCNIVNANYDSFIKNKLSNDWGRSKGGLNSSGSRIKIFRAPELSIPLAELCGTILGDGHLE